MFPSAQDVGQIRARVLHTIRYGLEFDLTTEQSKYLLKRHVNSNTTMVILFVDINGSTQMSITLRPSEICYYSTDLLTRVTTGNKRTWWICPKVCG